METARGAAGMDGAAARIWRIKAGYETEKWQSAFSKLRSLTSLSSSGDSFISSATWLEIILQPVPCHVTPALCSSPGNQKHEHCPLFSFPFPCKAHSAAFLQTRRTITPSSAREVFGNVVGNTFCYPPGFFVFESGGDGSSEELCPGGWWADCWAAGLLPPSSVDLSFKLLGLSFAMTWPCPRSAAQRGRTEGIKPCRSFRPDPPVA